MSPTRSRDNRQNEWLMDLFGELMIFLVGLFGKLMSFLVGLLMSSLCEVSCFIELVAKFVFHEIINGEAGQTTTSHCSTTN